MNAARLQANESGYSLLFIGQVTGGVENMITVELITGMVITVGSIVTLLMVLLIVQIYRSDNKGPRENGSH